MEVRILNIRYNLKEDWLYTEDASKRTLEMKGYTVEYYLNNYIRSIIEIPTNKELTIDEIKGKIKETYRSMVTESEWNRISELDCRVNKRW